MIVCCFQSGLLVMWKADTRGCLQMPLFQKLLGEPLTHVVITPPPVMEAAKSVVVSQFIEIKTLKSQMVWFHDDSNLFLSDVIKTDI